MKIAERHSERTLSRKEFLDLMDQEFAADRAFPLTVTGSSMEPLLRNLRDQVILVSAQSRPFRRGDIVLFRRKDGSFVLHRLIEKENDGTCVVNGDAQTWTERIGQRQILAVAEGIVRRGRYISCDSLCYRCCVRMWGWLRPMRKWCFAVGGRLKRFLKKLSGRERRRSPEK